MPQKLLSLHFRPEPHHTSIGDQIGADSITHGQKWSIAATGQALIFLAKRMGIEVDDALEMAEQTEV
ncbi:hypothetical protein NJ69_08090 [Pseudomonas parafulva]|nr:hypothetical protein NJ69_08090 [Pseudomonas parafulva]